MKPASSLGAVLAVVSLAVAAPTSKATRGNKLVDPVRLLTLLPVVLRH